MSTEARTLYFKLVDSADHHHFVRDFAVLFDAPIGDACGLKVLSIVPASEELPELHTIECDLSNVAERTVIDSVLEQP